MQVEPPEGVCEKLLYKSDVDLARLREQVEQTDPQLLDAMIMDLSDGMK
jgi:hypothetical protein